MQRNLTLMIRLQTWAAFLIANFLQKSLIVRLLSFFLVPINALYFPSFPFKKKQHTATWGDNAATVTRWWQGKGVFQKKNDDLSVNARLPERPLIRLRCLFRRIACVYDTLSPACPECRRSILLPLSRFCVSCEKAAGVVPFNTFRHASFNPVSSAKVRVCDCSRSLI